MIETAKKDGLLSSVTDAEIAEFGERFVQGDLAPREGDVPHFNFHIEPDEGFYVARNEKGKPRSLRPLFSVCLSNRKHTPKENKNAFVRLQKSLWRQYFALYL